MIVGRSAEPRLIDLARRQNTSLTPGWGRGKMRDEGRRSRAVSWAGLDPSRLPAQGDVDMAANAFTIRSPRTRRLRAVAAFASALIALTMLAGSASATIIER